MKTILSGLNALEFEHPFDKTALQALKKTPGLDTFLKWLWKNGIEKTLNYSCLASHLRITSNNLPEIYEVFIEAKKILDISEDISLYIENSSDLNAWTSGADKHIICLTSSLVNTCCLEQIQCIIGHELGHIKAGHVLYRSAANYLISAAEYLGNKTFGISGWISTGLQIPMLHWQRMSEFTADRAGLLTCQDFKIAQQVDMILAGFPVASISDTQKAEWVKQTKDFKDADYNFISKTLTLASGVGIATQLYDTHPFSVLRSAETIKWIESGGYSDVVSRKTLINDTNLCKLVCLNCGGVLFEDESFCPICGEKCPSASINPVIPKCVHCGNRIDDDAKYCNNCGEKIQE